MVPESLQVRRRPTRVKHGDSQRNSNVVRASVLETALELGLGQNSAVADWIFNNPLMEESEDHPPEPHEACKLETKSEPPLDISEAMTPTFTSGSNSTSDESSLYSPGNSAPSAAIATVQVHTNKPSITEPPPHVHFDDFPADQLQLFSPFALSPHDRYHEETRAKLSGKSSRDPERSRSQDDNASNNPSPGPTDSGYASEGQYLSRGKGNKGSDKPGKGNKALKPKALEVSKSSEKDGEYASDGGYLSASSNKSHGKSPGRVKSRAMAFFRRRSGKSLHASDDEDEESIPPVPVIPILARPSSPKPLERRAAPSSPARSGFSPLTLNLTNPPASPNRRRVSKSPPPPRARATSPKRSEQSSAPQRPASPQIVSMSTPTVPTAAIAYPLPSSIPGTPLSTASFPPVSTPKSLSAQSSRQHLGIPPPAPPPTLPLPPPPSSPSNSPNGLMPPLSATSTTSSRRGAPARPIPMTPGPTQPLVPRRAVSAFRPLISPRTMPAAPSPSRNNELSNGSEGVQLNGNEVTLRQRAGTAVSAGFGGTPAFLQRRIQHGPPPSPRPPPDAPLPPSPKPGSSSRPRTPIGSPSKFHEHLSSVSSVPISHILSTPAMSHSPSTTTLSGSSSGRSARSSHVSSTSVRSKGPIIRDSSSALEYSRPTTSASITSEVSYGQPIIPTFSRPPTNLSSQLSDRSDASSSIYSPTTHGGSGSPSIYDDDDDDGDVDEAASRNCVDQEDDDASIYPSDDKTAGRRTMYLVEHGELDANEDEIVIAGSHYWNGREVPPPLPPLPPMLGRPGPGYF